MSEMKHTPGPLSVWGQQAKTEIGGFYVIGPSDCHSASVAYVAHKADAELYAAAPDMLDALHGALTLAEMLVWPKSMGEETTAALKLRLNAIKSAIAKAEGRQP